MRFYRYHTIACTILLSMIAVGASAAEYTFEYQRIVQTDRPVDLNLNMATGSATFVSGDDDRLIIEAFKRVRATNRDEAEEVADHIEIRVEVTGGRVDIGTNYLKLNTRKRSFWNKILGTGKDSYGDVDYRITLPETNSLSVRAVGADISLSSVEARIDIENAAGSTRGEFLFGPVTLRQPTGEIDLQWVEGDIRISSVSSRITIRQVMGAIDLSTGTGDVQILTELDSPRDYFVETTTGKITLAIPESASGILSIQTESGDVVTEVPIAVRSRSHKRLVGEFGNGGSRITLSSSSGDVTVSEY